MDQWEKYKMLIWVYVTTPILSLTKMPKTNTREMIVSSANGAGKSGLLYMEEWTRIHIYQSAQNSNQNGLSPHCESWNVKIATKNMGYTR